MSGGYELHQKLRTKAVRQLKKKDYDGAITSLSDGARQLLEDREQGSGCDLTCYLLDVYQQAKTPSTEESRKRITDLVALTGKDFWRKKVIDAAVKWSAAVTSTPAGDGHLRLAIAEILSTGEDGCTKGLGCTSEFANRIFLPSDGEYYAAEPHYIVACSPPPGQSSASDLFPAHAPKMFACMMLNWLAAYAKEAVQQHGSGDAATLERLAAGSFALRGLLPYVDAPSHRQHGRAILIRRSVFHPNHQSATLPRSNSISCFLVHLHIALGAEAS